MGAACACALAALFCAGAQASPLGATARDGSGSRGQVRHSGLARAANVPYGGGPVLHTNRTHVIFWEPAGSGLTFDPGYESLVETFLADVAAASHSTTNVYALTGQYADASGPAAYDSTYSGAVVATDPLPSNGCTEPPASGPGWNVCLTDRQLQHEIEHVVRADHMPTQERDAYFLLTPDGLGSCSDTSSSSCALGGPVDGYCGYHSETADGLVTYAVIPFNAVPGHCRSSNPRPNGSSADPALSTISHEHMEMVTDPAGDAWIDGAGNEIGDLCMTDFGAPIGGAGVTTWNEDINGGHFFLQEEWSNQARACEPRARPDSISFAARPAARPRSASFLARAHDPSGSIVSYTWFYGDGRTGSGRRSSHQFTHPGAYRVTLRTTDSWGNWTFWARTIRVAQG